MLGSDVHADDRAVVVAGKFRPVRHRPQHMDAQPAAHIFHDVVFADRALSKHPALRKALALHLRQLVPVLPDGKIRQGPPRSAAHSGSHSPLLGHRCCCRTATGRTAAHPRRKTSKIQRQIDHAVPPNRHTRRAALNRFAVQSKRPFADRQMQRLRDRVAGAEGNIRRPAQNQRPIPIVFAAESVMASPSSAYASRASPPRTAAARKTSSLSKNGAPSIVISLLFTRATGSPANSVIPPQNAASP